MTEQKPLSSSTKASNDYARGYSTGRVQLLQGLMQRLREDEDLRTLAGLQEVLGNLLDDEREAQLQPLLKIKEKIVSKWKSKTVRIIQIIYTANPFIAILGLGGDGRIYVWSKAEGAWEKYWEEKDKPLEG